MDRYIGLDVHASSCTLAVVGPSGKRLGSYVAETNAGDPIEVPRGIPRQEASGVACAEDEPGIWRESGRRAPAGCGHDVPVQKSERILEPDTDDEGPSGGIFRRRNFVSPGDYVVELTVDGTVHSAPLTVTRQGRWGLTSAGDQARPGVVVGGAVESRTPPHNTRCTMRNSHVLLPVLATTFLALACEPAPEVVIEAGDPLPGLSQEEVGRFLLGKALFSRITSPEEGLGPTFNQTRCSACHTRPDVGGSGTVDATLGKARRWENETCDLLTEEGGDLIQKEATPLLLATGYVPPEQTPPSASVRLDEPALAIFGIGLVELVPEEDILSREDPDDTDGDGISGRAGRDISGHPGMEGKLGRFTRKAEWARLYDFVDAALQTELGLTTPRSPEEQTLNGLPVPPEADPAPDPEMDEQAMALLYDFIRFLAPPPPENITSAAVQDSVDSGERIFDEVGCTPCHTPTLRTGPSDIAAMANQTLTLYSDLLLHDLGPDNAGMCGPYATPSEYRTTMLWGLRFKNGFMHDGAATTLQRSIELHGGESEASRDAYDALSEEDKAFLMRFLASL